MDTTQPDARCAESIDSPSRPTSRPAAVLWDMDGTLIDSEPYWIAEQYALVESYGGTWSDELARQLVGASLLDSADFIREHTPVRADRLDIVHTLQAGVVRRLGADIPWRPGARQLLAALGEQGVPCALVTMSWRSMVEAVVANLPGAFAATISGEDVDNGKPHPEPYQRGAAALGVPVTDCIALEDSPTGVASALAARARTIAIPHELPITPAPGLALLPTLRGVTPADLVAVTAKARAEAP